MDCTREVRRKHGARARRGGAAGRRPGDLEEEAWSRCQEREVEEGRRRHESEEDGLTGDGERKWIRWKGGDDEWMDIYVLVE